ncbi:MAG: glycoside hydrolase family 5 protein [Gammaproteobacteria bacterium]|nr:glycoside hydrolase family 5 protein [Gammaproteobacteria bacterium]
MTATSSTVRVADCGSSAGALAFDANFPDHAGAEQLAARLQMIGMNLVRLHHMDLGTAPRGIWDPAYQDRQHLDAGQLDRLDYLVAQLKARGVYVNLNLHVSRTLGEADEFFPKRPDCRRTARASTTSSRG